MIETLEAEEIALDIATMGAAGPLAPVEPSYARKLVSDLAAWAQSLGFAPHRDFAVAERMFADVSTADCDAHFRFGCDGAPRYIPGPTDSPSQIQRRTELLQRALGRPRER